MPALGTSQTLKVQMLDYSGEREGLLPAIHVGEITAVSLPGFLTNLAALETAIDAIVLGTRAQTGYIVNTVNSNTRPADKNAQVETQMLVTYMGDTTEKSYSFRIPTVDYDAFNYVDDEVILSGAGASAATTAFITAFENIARAPDDDAETVTVTSMRVVR